MAKFLQVLISLDITEDLKPNWEADEIEHAMEAVFDSSISEVAVDGGLDETWFVILRYDGPVTAARQWKDDYGVVLQIMDLAITKLRND